jgi:secondary thiamine-phosphate synthase enzyme
MIYNQLEIIIQPKAEGFHLITDEILSQVKELPDKGIMHLFIRHTSAGLSLNENADPDVQHDLNHFIRDLVPENYPDFKHTMEGPDDMPAHIKSSLVGQSLQIPVSGGKPALGTWQGIYLCEFRRNAGSRSIIVTIIS